MRRTLFMIGIILACASALRAQCPPVTPFDFARGADWTGWSPDASNTHFQSVDQAGLSVTDIPRLKLQWAFGFPSATMAFAPPTVAGGRLFVGSQSGNVYSLDARTGCVIWTFKAGAGVRTAIALGKEAAYFGDLHATAYAVNIETGKLLWSRKLDEHPSARITGSPTLYQDRLIVPVSSFEEGQGSDAQYECCTFRGSVAALAIKDGTVIWRQYTIADEPKAIGKNAAGVARKGPSGAAVWSSPTIDAKRRLVYVATGNMYTEPQQPTSDAVLALDLDKGGIVWTAQVTPKDVFVVGCGPAKGANCPSDVGPDFDFGNSPMLTTLA